LSFINTNHGSYAYDEYEEIFYQLSEGVRYKINQIDTATLNRTIKALAAKLHPHNIQNREKVQENLHVLFNTMCSYVTQSRTSQSKRNIKSQYIQYIRSNQMSKASKILLNRLVTALYTAKLRDITPKELYSSAKHRRTHFKSSITADFVNRTIAKFLEFSAS
jgi:hypothetical protein